MELGSIEKSGWLADLILRESKLFEEDTGERIEDIVVSRIDGNLTSVMVKVRGRYDA